jgi:hypothetical protein
LLTASIKLVAEPGHLVKHRASRVGPTHRRLCIPFGDAYPVSDTSSMTTLTGARALAAVRARRRPRSSAGLACRLIPGYKVTPTIALISDALTQAVIDGNGRYLISTPPRTGKSLLTSVIGVLYALTCNPDSNVILASYADSLAWEHSHRARVLVTEHPELLGFTLRADRAAVGRWQVDRARPDGSPAAGGGLLAAGILSGITGFGADLVLIDDPIKNQLEADSAAHRRRVLHEFRSTLLTRLMPGASVVIISSRFHEQDLIGTLLAEEPDRWTYINIPAISEAGIPDALDREPGLAMTSALGRTADQFDDLRRAVGERAWYSLFQGVPANPEGALVKRTWLDDWRMPAAPQRPARTVVGVDPSDSGSGDSCGLVAASLGADGVVAVIADLSRPMTSDEWARAAVQLAIDVGASEVAIEAFAARETYTRVANEALRRAKTPHPIRVSAWPPKGSGRGGGDAVARAAALLQALEVGTCRLAGHFPDFEAAATSWQAGQHCSDALAALVVAHDVLTHAASGQWGFAPAIPGATLGRPTLPGSGRVVVPMEEVLRQRRSLRAM